MKYETRVELHCLNQCDLKNIVWYILSQYVLCNVSQNADQRSVFSGVVFKEYAIWYQFE